MLLFETQLIEPVPVTLVPVAIIPLGFEQGIQEPVNQTQNIVYAYYQNKIPFV